jgi:hypothetical protein
MASHTLTLLKHVDRLVNMESLGGYRPSKLLAEMDRYKPKDMHSFYTYHFLQHLPREVRILMAKEDASGMRLWAKKADELMALHLPQEHDVAAVEQQEGAAEEVAAESDAVAAISGKRGARGKKQQQRESSPSVLDKSPLCWANIRYGDKAWPEN